MTSMFGRGRIRTLARGYAKRNAEWRRLIRWQKARISMGESDAWRMTRSGFVRYEKAKSEYLNYSTEHVPLAQDYYADR